MKITKEEAKKLLETAEAILKEYETYTDPETGVTTDDEGNVVSHGWRGGRHSTNGYNRRYYNAPRPTPVTPTVPGNSEDTKWMKYLPSFRNKEWNRGKTDEQLKPLILAWLAKQQAKAAPPVAENMLKKEVKDYIAGIDGLPPEGGWGRPSYQPRVDPNEVANELTPSTPEEAQELANDYKVAWQQGDGKVPGRKPSEVQLARLDPAFYMQYGPQPTGKNWSNATMNKWLDAAKEWGKTHRNAPVAESMLENEVKAELLETATKLLQEAQKKLKGKSK